MYVGLGGRRDILRQMPALSPSRIALLATLLVGCHGPAGDRPGGPGNTDTAIIDTDSDTDTDTVPIDGDGDGYVDGDDCDDADPDVFPGATEHCDGVDEDCDGEIEPDGVITLDGDMNLPTIQQALNASLAGSEIVVCPGTWHETLEIQRPVTLRSRDGSLYTYIDGQDSGVPINATGLGADTLIVEGFTIRNGLGGGIVMAIDSTLELTGSVLTNNEGDRGGGLRVANATLQSVIVNGNESIGDGGGGGIWLLGGAVTCSESQVEYNVAWFGGGVAAGRDATLTGCLVRGNMAVDGGGLGTELGVVLDATGSVFEANDADYGGGAHLLGDELIGGDFIGNTGFVGGGIHVANTSAIVTDAVVTGNSADIRGGGVNLPVGGELVRVEVRDNTVVSGNGGGVFLAQLQLATLTDVTIETNDADEGAGLYLEGGASMALIGGNLLSNTSLGMGGGAYLMLGGSVDFQGTDVGLNLPHDIGATSLPAGIDLNAIVTVVCTNAGCP